MGGSGGKVKTCLMVTLFLLSVWCRQYTLCCYLSRNVVFRHSVILAHLHGLNVVLLCKRGGMTNALHGSNVVLLCKKGE